MTDSQRTPQDTDLPPDTPLSTKQRGIPQTRAGGGEKADILLSRMVGIAYAHDHSDAAAPGSAQANPAYATLPPGVVKSALVARQRKGVR